MNEYHENEVDRLPPAERGLTLSAIARVLRSYASPILLAMTAAAVAYLVGAIAYILLKPEQRSTNLGFRIEFPGAKNGQYPNGTKFSGSDIVDTPILRAAFDGNQLDRFMSFSDFSRSVVVVESNAVVNQLAQEYEAKLANPRLSPIERDKIETEYTAKRESLQKNDYALILTTREGLTRVPVSTAQKTLTDILREWSDFATKTRQVMLHRVPLVSDQALARLGESEKDPLAALLTLRAGAREMRDNIDQLATLPGAEVIRSTKRNASLRELLIELAQLERGHIEYTISRLVHSGAIDRSRVTALVESQLSYDKRGLAAADERVRVLRNSLEQYANDTPSPELASSVTEPARSGQTSAAERVVPQLSDTFLERIVALAQSAADQEYRQRQVEDIKSAALAAVPLQSAVDYEEQLLAELRSGGGSANSMSMAEAASERARITRELQLIAQDLIDIRGILSRSITPSGQMYTITTPAVSVVERSVSLSRLALGGILFVLIVTLAAIAAAFVHARLQQERNSPATT